MTKHNEWFEQKFLTSLKPNQWLSEKQMSICQKYMVSDRYKARTYRLAVKNIEYKVSECRKGYGKFYKIEYPYNVEEKVTDRFGNQYSSYL